MVHFAEDGWSVPDDEDEFSALMVQDQQRHDEDGQAGVLSEGVETGGDGLSEWRIAKGRKSAKGRRTCSVGVQTGLVGGASTIGGGRFMPLAGSGGGKAEDGDAGKMHMVAAAGVLCKWVRMGVSLVKVQMMVVWQVVVVGVQARQYRVQAWWEMGRRLRQQEWLACSWHAAIWRVAKREMMAIAKMGDLYTRGEGSKGVEANVEGPGGVEQVVRKLRIVSVAGVLAQGAEGAEEGVGGAAPQARMVQCGGGADHVDDVLDALDESCSASEGVEEGDGVGDCFLCGEYGCECGGEQGGGGYGRWGIGPPGGGGSNGKGLQGGEARWQGVGEVWQLVGSGGWGGRSRWLGWTGSGWGWHSGW